MISLCNNTEDIIRTRFPSLGTPFRAMERIGMPYEQSYSDEFQGKNKV